MRNILLVLVIAVLATPHARACSPPVPTEVLAHNSDFVLVGKATQSISHEKTAELVVSYEVLEVLAGKAPDSFHALSPCALPIRRGERILVGRVNGMQVAFPALSTEESVRSALRAGR